MFLASGMVAIGLMLKAGTMIAALPLPPGAYDVTRESERTGTLPTLQFVVRANYPSAPALEYYRRYFRDRKWVRCSGSSEEWQPIQAEIQGQPRRLRVQLQAWFDVEERLLAIVRVSVVAPLVPTDAEPEPTQTVRVMAAEGEEIESVAESFGFTCKVTPRDCTRP